MIDPAKYLALAFWLYAFRYGQMSSGERGRKRYKKLSGVPKPWVFAVVWTVLNICLGIAAWTALQHPENYSNEVHYCGALGLWLFYLGTLKLWSVAFDGKWKYWPLIICIIALLFCLSLVAMSAALFAISDRSSFDLIWPLVVTVVASAWHIYAVYLAAHIRDYEAL